MRPPLPLRSCGGSAWMAASLVLAHPFAVVAACIPAECEAQFACGSRECVGVSCETLLEPAGTECRPAAGVCDVAETCTGSSLSCPSDKKRPEGTECGAPTGVCDAPERCEGASNDCPADTGVGILPTLSRVTLVSRTERVGGSLYLYDFAVEVTGANLCTATLESPGSGPVVLDPDDGPPSSRLSALPFYNSPEDLAANFPNGTYHFDINSGAVAGTLDFAAGAPDGYVEILSPAGDATVGPDPTFSIRNLCSNCGFFRAEFGNGDNIPNVQDRIDLREPPAPGTEVELGLSDFDGTPPPLPDDSYVFFVEVIDGSLSSGQTFAGDSSGALFEYLSGSSERNAIAFAAPEAAALPRALAAAAGLAFCARVRGSRWRRG